MPRPGRSAAGMAADLKTVNDLGVSMIVTLTGEWRPPHGLFETFGLKGIYVPIADWQPPTLSQAEMACETVLAELAGGGSAVFHCQAGRGRTGTMLAAMLIFSEPDAKAAIGRVKSVNPDWIESEAQMKFLKDLAAYRRAATGGHEGPLSNGPDDEPGRRNEETDVTR